MTTPAFLDIHILHAVPFSNLNRATLGSPKQMLYGGTARARISSQCAKRAARLWLEADGRFGVALRTRRLPQVLREELIASHGFSDDDARLVAERIFGLAGIKLEEKGDDRELQGNQLTFTTQEAAADLAATCADLRDKLLTADYKKPPTAEKNRYLEPIQRRSPIIALCGRMLADEPGSNVDGALQMAHAFTTHPATVEIDYFTAVDDVIQQDDDETGAGHINTAEFTSGIFYRHATVGLATLAESLDSSAEATAETTAAFLQALVLAEPTGKQNTANAHTRPDLVAITLRTDRPVSFAAAFEKPVGNSQGGGYLAASAQRLAKRAEAETAIYGRGGLAGAWFVATPDATSDSLDSFNVLGDRLSALNDLTDTCQQAVSALVNGVSA